MGKLLAALVGAIVMLTPGSARAAPGDLLVSSLNSEQVLRLSGSTGARIGVAATGGGLVDPSGFDIGPDGNLYVCSGTNEVLRFDGQSGAFLGVYASDGGLAEPSDVYIRPNGDVLVTSANNSGNRTATTGILRFDGPFGPNPGGPVVVNPLNPPTSIFAVHTTLSKPLGMAIGPDGWITIANRDGDNLLRIHPQSGTLFGQAPILVASVLQGPNGADFSAPMHLAYGPDGKLYVTSSIHNKVIRVDPGSGTAPGAYQDEFVVDVGLANPGGLAFGPEGDLYVASFGSGTIRRYEGPLGANPGAFIDTFASDIPGAWALGFEHAPLPRGWEGLVQTLPPIEPNKGAQAMAISRNGTVVVGTARTSTNVNHASVWTTSDWSKQATIQLRDLSDPAWGYSGATAVSADGHVIVGYALIPNVGIRPVRWASADWTNPAAIQRTIVESISFGTDPTSYAVSADGAVVAGGHWNHGHAWRATASDWTNAATIVVTDLGSLGGPDSSALAASDDGSVIVGFSGITAGDYSSAHAFRYENGTMEDLGALGETFSAASAMSGDARTIAAYRYGSGPATALLLRNGVATPVGGAAGGAPRLNANGTVLIASGPGMTPEGPFGYRWTAKTGAVSVHPPGWDNSVLGGVSRSGAIAGFGQEQAGIDMTAFVLIPRKGCGPGVELVLVLPALLWLWRRRRGRHA